MTQALGFMSILAMPCRRDGIFLEENKDLVSEYDTVEAWWMEQEQERVAKKIQAKSAELQNVEPQTGGGEDQVPSTISRRACMLGNCFLEAIQNPIIDRAALPILPLRLFFATFCFGEYVLRVLLSQQLDSGQLYEGSRCHLVIVI